MTTVTVPTEVVVDQCMDLVAEEKTIVAKVPTEEDGNANAPIAGEQTRVVELTDPPPSYRQKTDGQDAPLYKQIFGMKRMHDLLEKAWNMSSNKDALAVKLGRNFKRSGTPPGMGKMRDKVSEAWKTSPNICTFIDKLCRIFCLIFWRSAGCLVCMLSLLILPIIMVVIGAVYFNECQRSIQIWLILFGFLSLFHTVINIVWRYLWCKLVKDVNYKDTGSGCFYLLNGFINVGYSILFLWGNIYVFKQYNTWRSNEMCHDPNNPETSCYCHPVPYLFSFITVIMIDSIVGLFFLCSCLYLCCTHIAGL